MSMNVVIVDDLWLFSVFVYVNIEVVRCLYLRSIFKKMTDCWQFPVLIQRSRWRTKSCETMVCAVCLAMFLTHRGRNKMDTISQTTFSNAFFVMKMFEFRLKFHWSLFPRVQLTIFQQWFRQWLGAVQVTSRYLIQWCLVYRRIYASLGLNELTHWGQVMLIWVSKLTIIGSDNGLAPPCHQAIIWTIAVILLIGAMGKNLN